jgi:hypothetical protein
MTGRPGLVTGLALMLVTVTRYPVAQAAPSPMAAVRAFGKAVLARDYAAAYDLIAPGDRAYKSREEYLRENEPLSGFALQLTRELARLIRDDEYQVESQGNRARVIVRWRLPEGNAPAVTQLVGESDIDKLNALGPDEQARLVAGLRELAREGRIPFLETEERFEVIRERGEWYVRMRWADIDLRGRPAGGADPLEWTITVTLRDQYGSPVDRAEAILEARMPVHPWHGVLSTRLEPSSPGVYSGNLTFRMPGKWVLQVAVFGPATGGTTVTLEVPASGPPVPAPR